MSYLIPILLDSLLISHVLPLLLMLMHQFVQQTQQHVFVSLYVLDPMLLISPCTPHEAKYLPRSLLFDRTPWLVSPPHPISPHSLFSLSPMLHAIYFLILFSMNFPFLTMHPLFQLSSLLFFPPNDFLTSQYQFSIVSFAPHALSFSHPDPV